MPVEIREIIIKTEISTAGRNQRGTVRDQDLALLKKQLLIECRRMLSVNTKRSAAKR
jgi:Family of unknown function (DUF5908)